MVAQKRAGRDTTSNYARPTRPGIVLRLSSRHVYRVCAHTPREKSARFPVCENPRDRPFLRRELPRRAFSPRRISQFSIRGTLAGKSCPFVLSAYLSSVQLHRRRRCTPPSHRKEFRYISEIKFDRVNNRRVRDLSNVTIKIPSDINITLIEVDKSLAVYFTAAGPPLADRRNFEISRGALKTEDDAAVLRRDVTLTLINSPRLSASLSLSPSVGESARDCTDTPYTLKCSRYTRLTDACVKVT